MLAHQSDRIEKEVTIKPAGVARHRTMTKLICPHNREAYRETIEFEEIENIVPGSHHLNVSAIADFLGPSIVNVRNILDSPARNGDKSSMILWSNILIFDYLQRFGIGGLMMIFFFEF